MNKGVSWLGTLVLSTPLLASSVLQGPPPPPSPPPGQLGAIASSQADTTGTGVLVGTVVDAGSGRALAGAIVTMNSFNSPQQRVLTGADGRFLFTRLAKGSYAISAGRQGYVGADAGIAFIDLAEGERRSGLKIQLTKPAVVAGTIMDEAGEPVIGVRVQVLKKEPVPGRPTTWYPANSATTDDRGVYRIGRLVPGDYAVYLEQVLTNVPTVAIDEYEKSSATPTPGAPNPIVTELFALGGSLSAPGQPSSRMVGNQIQTLNTPLGRMLPPTPDVNGKTYVYPPLFYPAARSLAQATLVSIASGEERSGIDLVLRPVRTIRVSGTLMGPDGPLPLTRVLLSMPITAVPNNAAGEGTVGTVTDAAGAFTFLTVPQGQYSLEVVRVPQVPATTTTFTDPTLWAQTPVVAGNDDITGLIVTARTGIRVGGRVEYIGNAPQPDAQAMSRTSVSFSSVDNRFRNGLGRTRVDAKGAVTSQGFPPGEYIVSASSGGSATWALHSAMVNGVDVSQVPLELTGADVDNLVIKFTDTPTELTGIVTSSLGTPDARSIIIVFPADVPLAASDSLNPRRVKRAGTTSKGTYAFRNLPAGDYYVIAIPAAGHDDGFAGWMTPQFLQSLTARATRVRIGESEKRSQGLQTVTVR